MSAPVLDDPAPFDLAGPLPSGTVVLEASAGTGTGTGLHDRRAGHQLPFARWRNTAVPRDGHRDSPSFNHAAARADRSAERWVQAVALDHIGEPIRLGERQLVAGGELADLLG